jgi:hypothetical protein
MALALGRYAAAVDFAALDRVFGGKGSGAGGFSTQINLAFDAENNIYVSDAATRILQKLDPNGAFLLQYPAADAESLDVVLVQPGDVAVDGAGNVYVADLTAVPVPAKPGRDTPPVYLYTPCVHKFDAALKFVRTIPVDTLDEMPTAVVTPVKEIVDAEGRYALAIQPTGYDRKVRVDVDPQGNLFVLDAGRASKQVVIKFSPDGTKMTTFGRYGAGDGEFDSPKDFAVGADGGVFVADTGNDRIVKFDNDGRFVTAFGTRGLGGNQVIAPAYIRGTRDNALLVKDDSAFVRKELRSAPLEVLSLSAFSSGQRALRPNLSTNPLQAPMTTEELLALRMRRLEELSLLDTKDKEEQEELEDSALKTAVRLQNTLYHTVFQRVLRFDLNGAFLDAVRVRLDQMSEELHDLVFVAADPLGRMYLQDKSDYTVRRYNVVGFTLRPQEVDVVSSSRMSNETNAYREDYDDLDQDPDVDNDEDLFRARQRLTFNYDLTERWNVLLENSAVFSGRSGTQQYPERIEDSLQFDDRNWDNDLYLGLRRVLNPNPYQYKEVNVFAQRQDGSSRLDSDALQTALNLQRARQKGASTATLFGLDWDLLRNANLLFQYYSYNPSETSRNYTRQFYDLQGNLYQVLRTRNDSKVFVGELNLKF